MSLSRKFECFAMTIVQAMLIYVQICFVQFIQWFLSATVLRDSKGLLTSNHPLKLWPMCAIVTANGLCRRRGTLYARPELPTLDVASVAPEG